MMKFVKALAMMKFVKALAMILVVAHSHLCWSSDQVGELDVQVEIEEDVYTFQPTDNGSGPMWCHGNTSIVRVGDDVFASGVETIPEAKPLNNCLPFLLHRTRDVWDRIFTDRDRTREPSPLAMFANGSVFLSVNPTRTPPDTYSGPAQPGIYEFLAASPLQAPRALQPVWEGEPAFSEHSYRTFVADSQRGEFILMQNVGYAHAEWSFRDRNAKWSAQGKLIWPWGSDYENPKPIRLCYPAVALQDRRVFFCGISDVTEPNRAWRDYKRELTGREWDYDFRRLFFTWSDDITKGEFHEWVEIASREKTAGRISICDLNVAPGGDVFVLWNETALDDRLRAKFFPNAKQRYSLECAILRDGKIVRRTTLVEGGDGLGGLRPGEGRFHVTKDNRLIVFYYQGGVDEQSRQLSENRIIELDRGGKPSQSVTVKLLHPFSTFFTSTVRAGCQPSDTLDILGPTGSTMRYARIRLQ